MSRGTTIALAVGVVLVGGLGFVVWYNNRDTNPTNSMAGGRVPAYVGISPNGTNPYGPPLPQKPNPPIFTDVGSAIQEGGEAWNAAKKAWDDISGVFKK